MNPTSPAHVSAQLRRGGLPSVAPWVLAQAVQSMTDSIVRRTDSPLLLEARAAVGVLNAHCHFEHARAVATTWLDVHGFDPTIQRRLVQALINTSLLNRAEQLGSEGLAKCQAMQSSDCTARAELIEYDGLLARISKQRFVDSGDLNALIDATDRYLAGYKRSPENHYWHGINAVACLQLERQYGPSRGGSPTPETLAADILGTVRGLYSTNPNSWLASTASEASLALKQCDDAELWLGRFLREPDTTRFNIDSYARQLREVWAGDPLRVSNCAGRLGQIIAQFIAAEQKRVSIAPSDALELKVEIKGGSDILEKNFSNESSFTPDAIRRLLKSFESIGCVMNDIGARLGTGFLVPGSWFKPAFGDAPVFVTNAHVISDQVSGAIPRDKASVSFELGERVNNRRVEYPVKEVLFSSDPGDLGVRNCSCEALDCTIVLLEGLPATSPVLKVTKSLPLLSPLTKAFVAGHPRGGGLQIALHDSQLLDIDDEERLMHYRTPTEPGSSGSPVFNLEWEVMALHHAGTKATPRLHGNGTYEANEGIALSAIRRKLNG
jgi:hypothetical protein